MSLVNENVTPYCYVKMSSPVLEAFCGGHEAGWIGSTDDPARDDEVGCGGVRAARRHPIWGGDSGKGRGAIGARRPAGHEGGGRAGRRLGREHDTMVDREETPIDELAHL